LNNFVGDIKKKRKGEKMGIYKEGHELRRYFRQKLSVSDKREVVGFISYGTKSSPIPKDGGGEFFETFGSGCFKRSIRSGQNIKMLVNHRQSKELGSIAKGNLKITENEAGR